MRFLTSFLAAAVFCLGVGACSDRAAPTDPGAITAKRASDAPSGNASASPTLLRFASWAPQLATYDTTFVLRQGRAGSDTIYFQKGPYNPVPVPFLVLTTPRDAQFVDPYGNPLPKGSEVLLTVRVDRDYVRLEFGPHGSTFSKNPAQLKIFWLYTDLLNRLGSDLRLWYQPVAGADWSPLATTVNLESWWLVSDLTHFSNYAVAF